MPLMYFIGKNHPDERSSESYWYNGPSKFLTLIIKPNLTKKGKYCKIQHIITVSVVVS